MHIAVEKQNAEIVQLLLSMSDTDVNVKQIKNSNLYESPIIKTPLMMSEEKENVNIMNLLKMHKRVNTSKEKESEKSNVFKALFSIFKSVS